jgi:putative NADPH-quinone reductase
LPEGARRAILAPEMEEILLVLGSSRPKGNTTAAVRALQSGLGLGPSQLVDLLDHDIQPFDYQLPMTRDDFASVLERLLRHQRLVFATPVYWYAMSGLMKNFFDRLTDLLLCDEGRLLGRALAHRQLWLLATGVEEELPHGFTVPFERTASYFSMSWKGACYVRVDDALPPDKQDLSAIRSLAAELMRPGA